MESRKHWQESGVECPLKEFIGIPAGDHNRYSGKQHKKNIENKNIVNYSSYQKCAFIAISVE